MQKLKISILLLVALVSQAAAQEFLAPYNTFVSNQLAYVITQEGDSIPGYLRSATEASGFIRRVSILDEFGNKHKFKAAELQRFAIQPGAIAKFDAVISNSRSLRQVIQTDFNEVLDRDWLIYDSQQIPRRNNKTGLLQLLNPGFDQHIKVYNHPNGSKAMPIRLAGVPVVGGEDRTFLVVKDGADPVIVRKAKYKKAFASLFGDDPAFMSNWHSGAKFRDFSQHVAVYSDLKAGKQLSARGN
jgi:hypothetical protein